MGVTTASNATPATMAANIKKISTGAELLWSRSVGSAQSDTGSTVPLDLSGYDAVIITYAWNSTAKYYTKISKIVLNVGTSSTAVFCSNPDITNPISTGRMTAVSTSGVTFGNGYNENHTEDGRYCYPYEIYGFKYA